MASPSLMSPAQDFGFTSTQIGTLGCLFFCIYAFGRLFNGVLSDRVVPWFLLTAGLLLTGVSNIISGLSPCYLVMTVFWCLNAFGQSLLWGPVLRVVSSVYSGSRRTGMASLLATSVACGNVVGIVFSVWTIHSFGVRYAFIIPGAVNVVIALLCARYTRSVPVNGNKGDFKFRDVFALFFSNRVRPMLVPAVGMGLVKESVTFWLAVYFTRVHSVDLGGSMLLMLCVPIVGFVGRCSYHAAYLFCGEDEHCVSRLSFIMCAVLSVLFLLWNGIPAVAAGAALSIIYFAVSLMNTSFLTIYPLRFAEEGAVGSVSGIMDFMNYGGAGVGTLAYGVLLEHFGFTGMFLSWFFIALLSWFLLRKFAK